MALLLFNPLQQAPIVHFPCRQAHASVENTTWNGCNKRPQLAGEKPSTIVFPQPLELLTTLADLKNDKDSNR
ncbi:MAG TPA: hypothetical protein VJ603_01575 [Paucimonas sp.]|nr:hypothetical protein [Paucimonas sp.]